MKKCYVIIRKYEDGQWASRVELDTRTMYRAVNLVAGVTWVQCVEGKAPRYFTDDELQWVESDGDE